MNDFVNNPYSDEVKDFVLKFKNDFDRHVNTIQMSRWFGYLNNDEIGDKVFDNPKLFIENDIKRKYLQTMLKATKKLADAVEFQIIRSEEIMDKASKSKTEYCTLKFFEENSQ